MPLTRVDSVLPTDHYPTARAKVRNRRREGRPGYLELDLTSHSGRWAVEEWIYTLSSTDLVTGWSELVPHPPRWGGRGGTLQPAPR